MTAALTPADEAGVRDAVLDARAGREPLKIQGRGTKDAMLRPVQAARTLSAAGLQGITLYSPQELIVSARAGTTLAEIRETLAANGQHLISEAPDLDAIFGPGEATLGGAVAANLSGPRRIAWGATRDHVMGVRFVNGAGEIVRSGGRVLKNVTGLDLCKLLAGSHGTLGVLTEITLKVLPAPERVGTLVLPIADPVRGVAALSAALGSPYGVSGAAWLPGAAALRISDLAGSGAALAIIRIEDFAASVAYRMDRLRADLAEFGDAEVLDDDASRRVWQAVRDVQALPLGPDDAVWRVSVRPARGPGVLSAVSEAGGAGYLDWGGGLVWAAGPAAMHDAVCAAARAASGVWTVMRGPEPMRAGVHVVPPEPGPLARITRRVKAALDPDGILNPGRLYAGI